MRFQYRGGRVGYSAAGGGDSSRRGFEGVDVKLLAPKKNKLETLHLGSLDSPIEAKHGNPLGFSATRGPISADHFLSFLDHVIYAAKGQEPRWALPEKSLDENLRVRTGPTRRPLAKHHPPHRPSWKILSWHTKPR